MTVESRVFVLISNWWTQQSRADPPSAFLLWSLSTVTSRVRVTWHSALFYELGRHVCGALTERVAVYLRSSFRFPPSARFLLTLAAPPPALFARSTILPTAFFPLPASMCVLLLRLQFLRAAFFFFSFFYSLCESVPSIFRKLHRQILEYREKERERERISSLLLSVCLDFSLA